MKKLILFFLFIPLVLAMNHGGEKIELILTENCVGNLTIDVQGSEIIEQGEYWFRNCTEISNNSWSCDCSEEIILETHPGAINNYSITLSYNYLGEEPEVRYIYSGGGTRTRYIQNQTNVTVEKEKIVVEEVPIPCNESNETISEQPEIIEEPIQEKDGGIITEPISEPDLEINWIYDMIIKICIVLLIVITGLLVYYTLKRRKIKKEEQE